MSSKTTFIYGLADPKTGFVRYVGKSNNPKSRLHCHIHASKKHDYPVHRWIRKLKRKELEPSLIIIDEVPRPEWKEHERFWISFYRCLSNTPMLNVNEGGYGPLTPRNLPCGEDNHNSVLTEKEVVEMRTLRQDGMALKYLAQMYGIHTGHVSLVCSGKAWVHAGGPITSHLTINIGNCGEDHACSKLTWEEVRAIRREYSSGNVRQVDLSKKYNITQAMISLIVRNENWIED